jgi:PTS system glucose-specific IIA component
MGFFDIFKKKKKKGEELEILAPVDGTMVALEKVPDDVFAQKMMGDGFAIDPSGNDFVAPMAGELVTVFDTGHAYGIRNKDGIELLMHVGLDTVNLKGEGFDIKVKQGDKVEAGDPLVTVDLKAIKDKVPSLVTPLVFTSDSLAKNGKSFEVVATGKVKKGDVIAIVK